MRVAVVTRSKPDAAGTLPLYVRLTHGGVKRYVALGFRVAPKDWNARKREVRSSHPHAKRLNRILRERLATAEGAALELQGRGRHFDADDAKAAVLAALHPEPEPEAGPPLDVIAYGRALAAEHEAKGKAGTAKAYGVSVNVLEKHVRAAGLAALPFGAVTAPFVRGYAAALAAKGLRPATVFTRLAVLRVIVRRAEAEGVPGAAGALRAVKAVRVKNRGGEKKRLTYEQVQALLGVELGRGRRASILREIRDLFAFSFFVGGMRHSDVCLLRWEHVDTSGDPWRVRWRQKKTADAHSLPVLGPAREVLERWRERTGEGGRWESPFVFGLVTEREAAEPEALRRRLATLNRRTNRYLRALCEAAEVPVVTYHGARHSAADHLRKSGADLYTISRFLGHGEMRTTEGYLASFDEEGMDAQLRRALLPGKGGSSDR